MTNIPLPIYVALFFFLGGSLILNLHHRYQNRMRALPQRDEYLSRHGQRVPLCHDCGADALDEKGLSHGSDRCRVVSCAKCSTMLYQFVDERVEDEDAHWPER